MRPPWRQRLVGRLLMLTGAACGIKCFCFDAIHDGLWMSHLAPVNWDWVKVLMYLRGASRCTISGTIAIFLFAVGVYLTHYYHRKRPAADYRRGLLFNIRGTGLRKKNQ
jgi:hypothetical protein